MPPFALFPSVSVLGVAPLLLFLTDTTGFILFSQVMRSFLLYALFWWLSFFLHSLVSIVQATRATVSDSRTYSFHFTSYTVSLLLITIIGFTSLIDSNNFPQCIHRIFSSYSILFYSILYSSSLLFSFYNK